MGEVGVGQPLIQSLCESCSDNMFLYRDSGREVSEVHYFDMESAQPCAEKPHR